MARTKVWATLEKDLAAELDRHFRKLVADASLSGKSIPKAANFYEELIKKGWEATKKELRK